MRRCFAIAIALVLGGGAGQVQAVNGCRVYGGDPGGTRYSSLAQIDRGNVGKLEVAWTYRTGELGEGFATADKLAFEATPILVDGRLYLSTPTDQVIALNPESGRDLWRYDPKIDRGRRYAEATSRGISAWRDPEADPAAACALRIFIGDPIPRAEDDPIASWHGRRRPGPAPPMLGRSSRSTRSAICCSFRPARRARTSLAASAWATTLMPTRSWRCGLDRRAGLAPAAGPSRPLGL